MDMREYTQDKCSLAQSYADDGAYASAARVLREAAATLQAHAERVSRLEAEETAALAKED